MQTVDIGKFAQHVAAMAKLVELQQESISALTHKVIGLGAAVQVIVEIIMSVNSEIKIGVSDALGQILAREDVANNAGMREILSQILEASKHEPRTTPEGRRSWLRLVINSENEEGK